MVEEDLLEDMDHHLVTAMVIHIRPWDEVLRTGTFESNQLQVMADDPRQVPLQHLEVTGGNRRLDLHRHQEDMAGSHRGHPQHPAGMGGSHLRAQYQRQRISADGLLQARHRHLEVILRMARGNRHQELRG